MTCRALLPLTLAALFTACAPTQTAAPDLTGSPLGTGQVWKMQTPAGPTLLERTLTVGERELQADGTVAYTREPELTLTGHTEDVFWFVPQGRGRDAVVAGRATQTFDLRFFDFCVLRGAEARKGAKQQGRYFKAASLNALRRKQVYRAYLASGDVAGLPLCTLERRR